MPIVAKSTSNRVPAPAGLHRAVCVDVIDKGLEMGTFGAKHKVVLVWEIDKKHPDFDGPFRVSNKYTLSLHEKATLSQHLESWRGRAFSDEERRGFDLERLICVRCLLNLVHREANGTMWANVAAVLPMPKDQTPLEPSGHYVRVIDRGDQTPDAQEEDDKPDDNDEGQIDDLDLPF